MLEQLTSKALNGEGCTAAEALWLSEKPSESELFDSASQIREHFFGSKIQLCSIINAKSGQCDMDCSFCSQSAHNSADIEEYPFLGEDDLEGRITETTSAGDRRCGIVTSGGRLSESELDTLLGVARKKPSGKLCASLGRLAERDFQQLKDAGINRFHHNLEASRGYYPKVCSTQTWEQRMDTVIAAKEAGMDVCCGGLFGMGESWEDRVDLAISLRDAEIEHVPINFLYAHKGTPLEKIEPINATEALRIVAVYRLLLPTATLRICGGREHVLGERQIDLFAAGANGIMTGNYLTVTGRAPNQDLQMVRSLGLEIDPA